MRLLSLALALGLVGSTQVAEARSRAPGNGDPPPEPPPQKQSRRRAARTGLLEFAPSRSPSGLHLVEVDGGAVFVDGRRVHPGSGAVQILSAPAWRADGDALAWLERRSGETRLVVLPSVNTPSEPIVWPLPRALSRDRVLWAAQNKVIVGPELLQPRAVASWSD